MLGQLNQQTTLKPKTEGLAESLAHKDFDMKTNKNSILRESFQYHYHLMQQFVKQILPMLGLGTIPNFITIDKWPSDSPKSNCLDYML